MILAPFSSPNTILSPHTKNYEHYTPYIPHCTLHCLATIESDTFYLLMASSLMQICMIFIFILSSFVIYVSSVDLLQLKAIV